MYKIKIIPSTKEILDDLKNSNSKAYDNVVKKIYQIEKSLELNPNHYKNLKSPLQEYKRVHVNKHFVIVFKVDNINKTVTVFNYKHQDLIYK